MAMLFTFMVLIVTLPCFFAISDKCILAEPLLLLYSLHTWSVRNRNIKWMCGHARKDRAQNDCIWEDISVTLIEKKIKNQLRWFGHGQRKPLKVLVRRVDSRVFSFVKTKRGSEKLKGTLEEIIIRNLTMNNIRENLVFNQWCYVIHVTDFT